MNQLIEVKVAKTYRNSLLLVLLFSSLFGMVVKISDNDINIMAVSIALLGPALIMLLTHLSKTEDTYIADLTK